MGRPLGSKNKPKVSASDTIVLDGYAEVFTGIGTNRDRTSYARAKPVSLLSQIALQDLYIGDGMARRVVDVPAEEMTRAGIDLEEMEDDDLEDAIEARLDELDAMRHMNDAVRWSRLYGGAVMIYGINDGGPLNEPLNPDGIRDVEFLRVYDRWQATVQGRITDPMSVDYGKPEMWLISPRSGGSPYQVHHSRVHIFDGEALPDLLRYANLGWGASVLQSCNDQLKRLGMSHQWTERILERSQQAVHKIPQLASTLRQPGGDALVQKRVDVVDMVRGIMNTVVVDGEEDYSITSLSMTGLPDVLDRFAEALSAVTGIPVTVLMGRAPGGLSSTGKSDLENWYARIAAMQNDILRKPLDRLINYIGIAKTGKDLGDYKLCFKPLNVLSDKERAEVKKLDAEHEKAEAETEQIYVSMGALDPSEVRKKIADEYGLEIDDLSQEEIGAAVVSGEFDNQPTAQV